MRFIAALFAATTLIGCGDSSKLTRSSAKDLVQRFSGFNVVVEEIPIKSSRFLWDGRAPMDAELRTLLTSLAADGLLTHSESYGEFSIALTEKGRTFKIGDGKNHYGTPTAKVKLCDRQIEDVSGIEQPTTQSAIVNFTYKTIGKTAFGSKATRVCSEEIRTGRARMTLFDDGWRVVDVRNSDPRWGSTDN